MLIDGPVKINTEPTTETTSVEIKDGSGKILGTLTLTMTVRTGKTVTVEPLII
jgi:hypothetical protein